MIVHLSQRTKANKIIRQNYNQNNIMVKITRIMCNVYETMSAPNQNPPKNSNTENCIFLKFERETFAVEKSLWHISVEKGI